MFWFKAEINHLHCHPLSFLKPWQHIKYNYNEFLDLLRLRSQWERAQAKRPQINVRYRGSINIFISFKVEGIEACNNRKIIICHRFYNCTQRFSQTTAAVTSYWYWSLCSSRVLGFKASDTSKSFMALLVRRQHWVTIASPWDLVTLVFFAIPENPVGN